MLLHTEAGEGRAPSPLYLDGPRAITTMAGRGLRVVVVVAEGGRVPHWGSTRCDSLELCRCVGRV
jgi:hypothetical protein